MTKEGHGKFYMRNTYITDGLESEIISYFICIDLLDQAVNIISRVQDK